MLQKMLLNADCLSLKSKYSIAVAQFPNNYINLTLSFLLRSVSVIRATGESVFVIMTSPYLNTLVFTLSDLSRLTNLDLILKKIN